MKKFLALVLAVSMLLALAACGKKDPTPTPDDQQNPDTESEYPSGARCPSDHSSPRGCREDQGRSGGEVRRQDHG